MLDTIRLACPGDAAGCLEIYRPIVAQTPTSFETTVPDERAFALRIAEVLRTHPWLVYESDDGIGGYALAAPHRTRAAYRWCAEVSVYVAAGSRRRGVAQRLYGRLLSCLRYQGFFNAYAGIALPNDASVAFHEAMGFLPVGVYRSVGFKLGRWHDVGWWGLRLLEADSPQTPPDPRPLGDCRGEIDALLKNARG